MEFVSRDYAAFSPHTIFKGVLEVQITKSMWAEFYNSTSAWASAIDLPSSKSLKLIISSTFVVAA